MSFMDDFEESSSGIEIDFASIPGFTEQTEEEETPRSAASSTATTLDDDTTPDPKKYVAREDFETLQSQMGELKDLLLKQATTPQQPQIQYVPQAPQQSPETLKAQLEQQYYADPIGFTARLAQQSAQNSLGNDMAMIRETMTESLISQFESSRAGEPVYKAAQKHFKEQVGKVPRANLARLTPQQVNEFLEISYNAALGKVYSEVITKQQKANPRQAAPAYGGATAGGGNPTPTRSNNADFGGADARLAKALGLSQEHFDAIND